jgi:hypothetical protein
MRWRCPSKSTSKGARSLALGGRGKADASAANVAFPEVRQRRLLALVGHIVARDRRGPSTAIPSDIAKYLSLLALALSRDACGAVGCREPGISQPRRPGTPADVVDPCFDLDKVPGNAPVCQIETAGEAPLHLEHVDGCIAERDHLTELLSADDACLWGRGHGPLLGCIDVLAFFGSAGYRQRSFRLTAPVTATRPDEVARPIRLNAAKGL